MKDKRNCNNDINYPVYPPIQNFGGSVPMMMPPMGMGYPMPNYNQGISQNTFEQQINNLEQQLNLLDQRITRLERQYMNSMNNNTNYNSKYNDSNYYMV